MSGAYYILICYLAWGLLPIFWKLLSALNPVYVLASRLIWAMIFGLIILALNGRLGEVKAVFKDRREFLLLLLTGILITVNWGFYIAAVSANKILDASLAYYMNPLFSVLIGLIFYREKVAKLQWLAIGFAFVGVVISVVHYGQVPYYALVIAISFAVYGAFKKLVSSSSMVSTFVETLWMAPLAFIFIISCEKNALGAVGTFSGSQWLLLPLSGIVTSVPLMLFSKGIKNTSLTLSGVLMYVNPTLQLLIGVFLYKEPFPRVTALTFIFVWVGLVIFVGYNIKHRKDVDQKRV